jgi:hypothetical protein
VAERREEMVGDGQMAAATFGLRETSPDGQIFICYFHLLSEGLRM